MLCNLFSYDVCHVLQIHVLYFHVLQFHVRHFQSTRQNYSVRNYSYCDPIGVCSGCTLDTGF